VVKDTETRATQRLSERQPLTVPGRHGQLILRPIYRPTITVPAAFQGQGCRADARHIGPTTLGDGDSAEVTILTSIDSKPPSDLQLSQWISFMGRRGFKLPFSKNPANYLLVEANTNT
jgi:hypothetical protein